MDLGLYDGIPHLLGTLCHLSRLYLGRGRQADARRHAIAAWELRMAVPRYVIGRALWFLTLFALIDGTDALPWIGRINTLGVDHRETTMDWTMEPVLENLRERTSPEAHAIISALFHAPAGHDGGGGLFHLAW